MNSDIIIFSTTRALTKRVKQVLEERKMTHIPIYELTMNNALKVANDSIKNGTKIIICRGGTAEYLRKNVDVPVVDIRHGFLDLYRSIKKAKQLYSKIAVIGFKNLCNAAKNYNDVMEDDIIIAEVEYSNEFEVKSLELAAIGIEVLIGGLQVEKIAKENNIPFISGDADEIEINQAINEALHDLKIEEERRREYEVINTILNNTSEGIIGIKKDGTILHINEIAKQLLNYKTGTINVSSIFPSEKLINTAQTGESHFSELMSIGNRSVVVNSVPILVEDDVIGAVATIQEENYVQSMDRKIRKKYLNNGHVAKKTFEDIIGTSKVIEDTKQKAKKYSKSDSTILITGETGTGKEIFAQSIHNYSIRRNNPFVAINCAALPENILESELFGYVRGAFTGAKNEGKEGIFELAHTGTVFLDEISEISTDVQVKLLRVLQEKEVARIGDDKIIPIDVRIIAACNKDLIEEINKGKFREDLYYRICVLELNLPPLRQRKGDISELIHYFIDNKKNILIKEITLEAIDLLSFFRWPGNIRQLSNIVERLGVLCEDGVIDEIIVEEALSNMRLIENNLLKEEKGSEIKSRKSRFHEETLKYTGDSELIPKMEMQLIKDVLEKTNGNREKAAAILGISTTTLWRKMKERKN